MRKNNNPRPSVPASLRDLDLQQTQFVTAFIELGGRPVAGAEAALRAGYGNGSYKDAKRCADTLLSSPKITAALREEVAKRFVVATVLARQTLIELCQTAPPATKLAAAKEILDRGIGPVMSRSAHFNAEVGVEDLLAALDAERQVDAEHRFANVIDLSATQYAEDAADDEL